MKNIYILGGGTFSDVRCHQSLAVRAFGDTAIELEKMFKEQLASTGLDKEYQTKLILTRMAQPHGNPYNIITNQDASDVLDTLIADPDTKVIVQNFALCDFDGQIGDVPSGKLAERLRTSNGNVEMVMTPAPKLIKKIREERKDIFAIGFKTTDGQSADIQYVRGLELLKVNSLNLVLANDVVTLRNMIIAPEETRYGEQVGRDRSAVLKKLVEITLSRMQNHFTRSTVVQGKALDWNGEQIPQSLRTVVNHCIKEGAYKPFLGKTAGHFAAKLSDNEFATSIRKSNFNQLDKIGLVKIESKNNDEVIAHGFKPSVGGQSQRSIFAAHPELDCIVHFHCPVKIDAKGTVVPVAAQWPNECGSHECGQNTSNHLREVDLGDGESLKVVYLDEHGPNIVFNRKTNANKVINFIDRNFDLSSKTGGFVQLQ
jgi:hypothetical protein